MAIDELRFRQIHLDFHTHQDIPGIGADFDPDEYAETLKRAYVDSINTFARGHHGYIYYRSKKFKELEHPHLTRDLLREQIEACHRRDIQVPIYVTVQWDEYTAYRHPEWRIVTAEGALSGTQPYQAGFYRPLCLNSPYVDFLEEFTRDLMGTVATDGLWYDIVWPQDCSCRFCQDDMRGKGIDPSDPVARKAFGVEVWKTFQRRMSAVVRKQKKDALIFYNAGHVGPGHSQIADAYTHFELESLPSGGWGYMHFPVTGRYARTLGKDYLGMTGKFHTSWGDFHSFKNQAALEFECFSMLALNAKCCVGDQLHPGGKICPTTYDLVGSVYGEVEKREPWCRGASPVAEIGVLSPEEFTGFGGHSGLPKSAIGVNRILQEGAHQFDMIDSDTDFGAYRLLVLPDEIPVDAKLAKKLSAFLKKGGAVLASHRAGLEPGGEDFALDALGVKLVGEAPYQPDYLVPQGAIGKGLPKTGHVMYMKALEVKPAKGAKTLCKVETPYFNRTWEHYCSHQHAPSSGKKGYAAVVRKGDCIYFAHPVFAQYEANAPLWVKRMVLNAIDELLGEPMVRHDGPSSVLAAINEQKREKRWVLHLLHYIPVRRSASIDVIEEATPLHDLTVGVKTPKQVRAVTCQPEGIDIPFSVEDGRATFTLPRMDGYQVVELKF